MIKRTAVFLCSLFGACALFSQHAMTEAPGGAPASVMTEGRGGSAEHPDSVRAAIMLRSEEDGGLSGQSFLSSVIPPPPQAAAITRYAEYPVSHTTGLPDISVPLYEIDLGGYTLPISISYHASGMRPDDIPGYVGSGWTLNAGGAVTRTILGKPDRPMTDSNMELPCYDDTIVMKTIDEMKDTGGGPWSSYLDSMAGNTDDHDTESDRYSFNVAGHAGVFRYSHRDREYVILNNSNWVVEAYNGGPRFRIVTNDHTEYEFDEEERSGYDAKETEPPYATAWYVTKVTTPYGDISFSYGGGAALYVKRTEVTATSGPRLELIEGNGSTGDAEYHYVWNRRKQVEAVQMHLTFQQRPLESIEWAGGKVVFEYSEEHPRETLKRLTAMKVYDTEGGLRKKVDFDNTDNWPTGDSRTGRRLLRSVTDSERGTWNFGYDKGTTPPGWHTIPTPNCLAQHTDFWGYLNTSSPSSRDSVFTDRQSRWLQDGADYTAWRIGTRDRNPSLAHTRAGVLTSVTFPTGGSVTYAYELNRFANMHVGGLRVKSYTLSEGDGSPQKTVSFKYAGERRTSEEPGELMNYLSYRQMKRNPAYNDISFEGNPWPVELRTCVAFPVSPVSGSSCPVVYSDITETLSDGSSVRYSYDEYELSELYGVENEYVHPSLYYQSINDWGIREPLLLCRTAYDADGTGVFEERNTYVRKTRRMFNAGVRTICPYFEHMVPPNQWVPVTVTSDNVAKFGVLQHKASTAHVRSNLLTSRTGTDLTTGFTTRTDYTYDDSLRTMRPRSVTVTGSDGVDKRTEYTYAFDLDDPASVRMVENFYLTDAPVETRMYAGTSLLSMEKTEYGVFDDRCLPAAVSSWSVPTGTDPRAAESTFRERKRVSGYNAAGRPLSVRTEDTDVTSFSWDTTGTLLQSMTAPGGLKTTYTHRPLVGLASMTLPNGHKTTYAYNSAGMPASVSDNSGKLEEHTYSMVNHPTLYGDGNSVTKARSLNSTGTATVRSRQYHDGLGRPTTLLRGGINTTGAYVFSTSAYDNLGRRIEEVLPGAGGKTAGFSPYTDIIGYARASYGEDYVKSQTVYDALDRPVKVTTPGDAWHSAGKAKTTEYISNAAGSVRLYRAPMDRISLVEDGYYAAGTLQGTRTVDEDGNEMTVYTDRLGRKVLERRGPESGKGKNDTYFVHNALGQLRYVLSPGYGQSGFKEKFAYEYRYDMHGNVVKKFIPGAGYTQYWYDRAGRLAFMQDPNLRERGEHRFFVYDRAGRPAIQGVSASCDRSETVNFADYAGGKEGFMQTGYTLADASRLRQVTLEAVSYYDAYTFASALDTSLFKSGAVSAKGMQTGSVTYGSDGRKSMTAIYYDIRGNVTEIRERTPFGTLRTIVNTYTYTGQPLKSTVTEGTVTTVTENTYDSASGLLTATDVTVNGVKQRVSAVEYDGLGRIASVTRGAATGSGGKVEYTYNIHGQTTEIKGPGLTQNLHYTDGPGKKLYNGSVSAMTWTMGTDTRVRGYKYSYNGYGWLTAAEYGEHSDLGTNTNRYTERFLEFMPDGGVRRMQRHGLKADGVYGKVDNLHISYDGNRMTGVVEDADPVTQPGSMDHPGTDDGMVLAYNGWGALVRDEARGITDIDYDRFGNPLRIHFSGGRHTDCVYSADGVKLSAEHHTSVIDTGSQPMEPSAATAAMTAAAGDPLFPMGVEKTEYRGNVIYRNGKVDMVLFPGGYATINGTAVTFHYYTQDYLGNNRAVINGSTGAIEQTVAYYPYGGVIADLGTKPTTGQPYRFGGKELITANGLNEYDFGARWYYSAVPGFTTPDPCCEVFRHLSPYLYCGNNPVNLVDRNGLAPTEEEAARMADYVYGEEKIKLTGGWKESQQMNGKLKMSDDSSGFKSGLFERTVDGVTEYAYAYAGIDFTSWEDWENNFQQIFGNSEQYTLAIFNAGVLKENLSEELTFVGHSLGGGLAAASAYATGGHAMTFNAAGVSSATLDTSAGATIDAFVTRNDELNIIQSRIPGVPIANGNINWRSGYSSLLGHSIKNFYEPSMAYRIYNQFKDGCIRAINQLNSVFRPSNLLSF